MGPLRRLSLGRLRGQGINLGQHLFYPGTYLLALLAQGDHLGAQRFGLFLALFQLLAQAGEVGAVSGSYIRAVLVTRNDYTLSLFNGDVGLVLPDPGDAGSPFLDGPIVSRRGSHVQLAGTPDALSRIGERGRSSPMWSDAYARRARTQ